MRTHTDILTTAGANRIAEILPSQSIHTIRSWRQRDSIPAPHWQAICDAGIASLEELASAAATRSQVAA